MQKTAYELHTLGQRLIPFERKHSTYGEMYQYDFESFLRYVLKVFNLDVIAHTESVELSITLDGESCAMELVTSLQESKLWIGELIL